MPKTTLLARATKKRFQISTRQAVAILFIVLGAGSLLAAVLTVDTNQPTVTCATISDAALNVNPVVSNNIRRDALALTHAAADTQQANSIANRLILQRQVTARKQQLRALIRANPVVAREMLLKDDERQRLEQTTTNCVEQEATMTGTFEAYVADDIGKPSVTYYYVRVGETLRAVYGMSEIDAPIPGSSVALVGFTLDGDFLLADPAVDQKTNPIKILSAPMLVATSSFVKPLLMLMGDFANTEANWPTQAMGETAVAALNSYYAENSYGQVQWSPVMVSSGLETTIEMNNDSCEWDPIVFALVQAADPTVDFSQYAGGQLVIVAPLARACRFGGLASISPATYTFETGEGPVSMNVAWAKSLPFDWREPVTQLGLNFVLNHEVGHILNGASGMGNKHADWANCPAGQTFPDSPAVCTTEAYYDPYDVLGGSYMKRDELGQYTGYIDYSTGHYTADRKRWLGWFDTSQVVTITPNDTTQTVDLTPIEWHDAGVKMIKIQRSGSDNDYWNVEYRQPLMADGVTPTMDNIFSAAYPSLFTGALVHSLSLIPSPTYKDTLLLDASPTPINDASDVTVGVGQSLTDPKTGATLTVISRTSEILRVEVTPPAIDFWPPPPPLVVNDGVAEDIDTMSVGTALSANWTAVTDLGAGLERYEYQITSTRLGVIVAWKSNGTATAVNVDPISMTPGELFVTAVRAVDRAGKVGEIINSDGVLVAGTNQFPTSEREVSTEPLPPAQTCLSASLVTGVATYIRASWCNKNADKANVASYEYAIGTTPQGTDIVGYTNVGRTYKFIHQQLQLDEGLYYVSVRSVDLLGVAGPSTTANIWVDVASPPAVPEVRDGTGADIEVSASTAELTANWNSAWHQTALTYYYKIGTTSGGDELVSATSTGANTKLLLQNLRLVDHTRYYVSVVAKDAGGNLGTWRTSDGILIDVSSDSNPPSVSLQSPDDGATVSGMITVTAAASDSEALLGVQFQVDDAPYGSEITTAPFTIQWNTGTVANGEHTITAVARDTVRATTTSRTITVNNSAPLDTSPPTVSIVAPTNNIVVNDITSLTTTVVDSSSRTCTYYLDGQALQEPVIMQSPIYEYQWDSSTVPNGMHVLTLAASDAIGNYFVSSSISFFVNNPIPIDTTPPAAINDLRASM